jgi:hypothetical protein
MALQTIGLGTSPNDGTGDSIRVAGDKINDNFVELYNLLGDGTTLGDATFTTLDIVGNKASSVTNRVYNQSTSAGSQSMLSLQTGSANHLVNIVMNDNTGSGYFQFSSDTGVQAAYYDFAQHIFRSQGGSAERMRIDSSGNVGIGTSSPAALFHTLRPTSAGSTDSIWKHTYDVNWGIELEQQHVSGSHIQWNWKDAASNNLMTWNQGNVGIGTSSPDGKLHVFSGSAGTVTASTLGDDFVIENTGNMGISLLTNDTGSGYIFWGSPSDNDAAFIRGAYNSGSPYLSFGISGTERARIDSSGVPTFTQSVNSSVTYLTQTNNGTAGGTGLKITAQSGAYVGKFDIAAAGALAQLGTETNHPLLLITNNVEAARIDSSGNVGIGTTSPEGKAHIVSGSAGSVTPYADGDELIVEGSGNAGIQLLSPDANNTGLYFGSASDNVGAQILWNRTNNRLLIGTDNASAEIHFYVGSNSRVATLDSSGNLLIGTTTSGASKLVVADDSIQVNTAKTPASASATGTTGQIAWDASYIYVCTATNTWRRVAHGTW